MSAFAALEGGLDPGLLDHCGLCHTRAQMKVTKSALTTGAALLALTASSSCKEPEPDKFGTVRIELSPLGGEGDTVFAGTTEVIATVNYEDCLQDFYLIDRTDYQKDGPEGAPVFDQFAETLCTDYDEAPECEVDSIDQTLLEGTDVYNLKVTFTITDPSSLSYRELNIGPLPTEDLAGCSPIVELNVNGLIGRDANGTQIWGISTLPGSSRATTNQGAPLRVTLARK
ncbi:hypothetical protein G6O69_19300 [Pseudenhygromyxa sp. WMMC2535]|uniref:hypothetical protein n=1 Tax=Pseudenhygromyxa sp. WMMC2535 TaxID=2712867 RepID=UPI0015953057|nr:hypothetical protein [Pseudenhygromyxa sp. WMMC2535]NVB40000.1 hypothetical protein [Pseudenhygromyxa sp. WMMC2535]